jgi:Proteasome-substrate-size regulator, mid region
LSKSLGNFTCHLNFYRNHKDIDWEPYYEQLFSSFFLLIKNEFPKKVRTHVEQTMDYYLKFSYFYPRDYLATVASILAHLIRPKDHQSSSKCWEYFERIYQATVPFIHPENSGSWTRHLSLFYSHFTRAYITRTFTEKQKREKFQKFEKSKIEVKESDPKKDNLPDATVPEEAAEELNEGENENAEGEGEAGDEEDNESIAPEDDNDFSSHLDDYCHQKFLSYMIPLIKTAIFSPDRSVTDNAASLLRV